MIRLCNNTRRALNSFLRRTYSSGSTKKPTEFSKNVNSQHFLTPLPSPLLRNSLLALSATLTSAIIAATYTLIPADTHHDHFIPSNFKPLYASIERTIEQSNASLKRVVNYMKHSGLAASSDLLLSLRSVLTSANHEVRAGFERGLVALLKDAVVTNAIAEADRAEAESGSHTGEYVATLDHSNFSETVSKHDLCAAEAGSESHTGEYVVTLDHSNFSETVNKHDFIVVKFYAPGCVHCESLAPEYEKAASILSNHDPPVILAKIDADDNANEELAYEFEIMSLPTLKIFRNGGKNIQDYKGPRETDGIIAYLEKQLGPASVEIKSVEDASSFIDEQKISIVGMFPEFSGEEFKNFMILAEKMRSDYDFGHTLDSKLLPHCESSVNRPTLRLFKPFDELVVEFQDFHVDALEKFINEASVPIVTLLNNDPQNDQFVKKFFKVSNSKVMLFLNFNGELFDAFKSIFHDIAVLYKAKGLSFLLGDTEASQGFFEYFGLKDDQAHLIVLNNTDGQKYLKANLQPDHIAPWLKEYMDGKIKPFKKSEPIPEVNNEPVKVVVADSLQDMVFMSGKNVLLEFYSPRSERCKELDPILDEVAVLFESDTDVIIAKMDATANDIPTDTFNVRGFYPILYFKSASGDLLQYEGDRTKEDIINFIQKNRNKTVQGDLVKDEL